MVDGISKSYETSLFRIHRSLNLLHIFRINDASIIAINGGSLATALLTKQSKRVKSKAEETKQIANDIILFEGWAEIHLHALAQAGDDKLHRRTLHQNDFILDARVAFAHVEWVNIRNSRKIYSQHTSKTLLDEN